MFRCSDVRCSKQASAYGDGPHSDRASHVDEREQLRAKRSHLTLRHAVLQAVRTFMDSAGFLELSTPIRVRTPALEDYIEAEPADGCYLRTSPNCT